MLIVLLRVHRGAKKAVGEREVWRVATARGVNIIVGHTGVTISAGGPMVRISVLQTGVPGSNPGRRLFLFRLRQSRLLSFSVSLCFSL